MKAQDSSPTTGRAHLKIIAILFARILLLFNLLTSFHLQAQGDDLEKRRVFGLPENRAHKFQTSEEAFPRRVVQASNMVWKLEKAHLAKPFTPTYLSNEKLYTLGQFLERNYVSALLVLKDDKIVVERYLAGSSNTTRFFSFSTAKSITSTLVGMAIEDGFIEDVEDPLTKYLPALIGSAYETVCIKDALQMMTGVHDPMDFGEWNKSIVDQRYRFVERANAQRRERPPGTKFDYSTTSTALLGWLVETVTKKRLATYMEVRLWQPAGMEFDAAWLLDGPPEIGREMAGGNFAATLRDYGRFGLLALHGGQANGRQLISKDWFRSATTPDRPGIQYGKLFPGSPSGYGYSWWLGEDGSFWAEGVFGQYIFIQPKAGVVIVQLSAWPTAESEEHARESFAFFGAVTETLQ